MMKLSSIGALLFAALVAVLAMLGFSSPAQAYPDATIDLSVNRSMLYAGESFTATGSSQGTTCAWTLEWNGVVRHGSSRDGRDFVTTYQAPTVDRMRKIPLHGTCQYSAQAGSRGATTWERTIEITVLPASTAVSPPLQARTGGGSGSDLPNTGGPNGLFLLGGVGLLVAGATAVTVARRRAEEAELQASGA